MIHQELISRSQQYLEDHPLLIETRCSSKSFFIGAEWMCERMNEIDSSKKRFFDPSMNYTAYGIIKYGLCFIALLISFLVFYKFHLLLTPLSVLVFYLVEVHFLFLFPLMIDKVPNPVLTSIKETYRIGIVKAMITVMPIGFYMIYGLLNRNTRFLNWNIGCLSIVYWYTDEVRNRI